MSVCRQTDLDEGRKPELVISNLDDLPIFTGVPDRGGAGERRKGLETIASEVRSCTKCALHQARTNAVPGHGSHNARLMLVGEAPGREEDGAGLPFVGRAGRILDQALRDSGLERSKVFVTSILKCRPPGNRNPKKAEIEACRPYLTAQVDCIKPDAVLAMGNYGLLGLLGKRFQVSKARGRILRFAGIPVIPTYHPAACLRNPRLVKPFGNDVKKALRKTR
jgi:DNA polymerase